MSTLRSHSVNRRSTSNSSSNFLSSRRSRSLSGTAFSTGSFSSSLAQTKSVIALENLRSKKRNRGKFTCFHCKEEIKANESHDGVFRNIYRPISQGFVTRAKRSNRVLSAYVIISNQRDNEVEVIHFQNKDSFAVHSKRNGSTMNNNRFMNSRKSNFNHHYDKFNGQSESSTSKIVREK